MERIEISQLEVNPFDAIGKDTFLITAGKEGKWNTMTAGWGGLGYMWGKPAVFAFVRESRHTLSFLNENDTFSLSFFPPEKKSILAFCGSHSGRDTDKEKGAGLTPVYTDGTVAFEEANLTIVASKASCHLIDKEGIKGDDVKAKWYPNGDWHYMFVGFVEGIYVPETDITVVEEGTL